MNPATIEHEKSLTELFLLAGKITHADKRSLTRQLDQDCKPMAVEQPTSPRRRRFQQLFAPPWQLKETSNEYLSLLQPTASLLRIYLLRVTNLESTDETLRFARGDYRYSHIRKRPSLIAIEDLGFQQFAGHNSVIVRKVNYEQDGIIEHISMAAFDGKVCEAWYDLRSRDDDFTNNCYEVFDSDFTVIVYITCGHMNPVDIEIRIEALREAHANNPHGIEIVDALLDEAKGRAIANHEMINAGFSPLNRPESEKIVLMINALREFE